MQEVRELRQFDGILRQLVAGGGVHQPQPSFDRPQQPVTRVENLVIVGREQACPVQLRQRRERVGDAEARIAVGVLQLQHLHEELDVDDAAGAAFQIARRGDALLQPLPHLADFDGVAAPPAAGESRLGHRRQRPLRRTRRAVDRAGLAQRLPLPKLSAPFAEISGELVERGRQRAALSRWASRTSTSYSRP